MLLTIPLAFFTFFQCSPVQKLWHPLIPGLCHTRAYHAFIYADGGMRLRTLNIINTHTDTYVGYTALTDIALSIYPVIMLWPLQMDIRLKWIYRFLLGLVGFTCICSCFRTYSIYVINSTPLDTSYALTDLFIWGGIEMYSLLSSYQATHVIADISSLGGSRLSRHLFLPCGRWFERCAQTRSKRSDASLVNLWASETLQRVQARRRPQMLIRRTVGPIRYLCPPRPNQGTAPTSHLCPLSSMQPTRGSSHHADLARQSRLS